MDDTPLDPYAELGISKDATPEVVKAAYRRRAKETHPDAGGDDAEFRRVTGSWLILRDPKARKRFDETGNAEDAAPRPDEELMEALTIIDMKLQQFLAELFNPEQTDIVAKIVQSIGKDIAQKQNDISKAQGVIKKLKKLKPRFKAKRRKVNYIGNLLKAHIRNAEGVIDSAERRIAELKRAQKIAEGHTFEVDTAPPPRQYSSFYSSPPPPRAGNPLTDPSLPPGDDTKTLANGVQLKGFGP